MMFIFLGHKRQAGDFDSNGPNSTYQKKRMRTNNSNYNGYSNNNNNNIGNNNANSSMNANFINKPGKVDLRILLPSKVKIKN